ncbi:nucleoside hydrolase [Micromonospora sp. L31]|uniref:nucleoside hydrolase n=1 Tax=Micromonospora sp. L31 TaxID=3452213 RepID=UPI003F8AB501
MILDCDPGHDDALAMMLAHGCAEIELAAVTTVAGNRGIERTSRNAQVVATVIGMRDVPIAAGCAEPISGTRIDAAHIHGVSGLDGPHLPRPDVPLADRHAVDLMIDLIMGSEPGELTIVATGPATNLAAALTEEPAIASRAHEVVLMGGSYTTGNITPVAEFNVYADPAATATVLAAEWDVVMVGLDVTHQVLVTAQVLERISAIATEPARFAVALLRFLGARYAEVEGMPLPPLHDPCALAYVIDRGILETRPAHVGIERTGQYTKGATVTDFSLRLPGAPLVQVGVGIDVDRFWSMMLSSLARIGQPATRDDRR